MPKRKKLSPAAAQLCREAEETAERVRWALVDLVHNAQITRRELARRTGRSGDYWTKMFNGQRQLHARHIFQVLFAVGEPPGDFLAKLFPPESGTVNPGTDLMTGLIGFGKALRLGLTLEEVMEGLAAHRAGSDDGEVSRGQKGSPA
jgi:hypothetical protein